ncbi:MAG: glycosyltransferase [Anaerolineales bacterium]
MIHYAYQMCKALANQGADVTLVTDRDYELLDYPHNFRVENRLKLWSQHDPQSSDVIDKSGFQKLYRKVRWTIRRGIRAFYLIKAWMDLSSFLDKSSPDIVQFGKINFPFEAIFLRRIRKKDLILTQICHEFERRESSGLFSGWVDGLYNTVLQNFSFLFFHAEENRERFQELFDYQMENSMIIPHGNQGMFQPIGCDGETEEFLSIVWK